MDDGRDDAPERIRNGAVHDVGLRLDEDLPLDGGQCRAVDVFKVHRRVGALRRTAHGGDLRAERGELREQRGVVDAGRARLGKSEGAGALLLREMEALNHRAEALEHVIALRDGELRAPLMVVPLRVEERGEDGARVAETAVLRLR